MPVVTTGMARILRGARGACQPVAGLKGPLIQAPAPVPAQGPAPRGRLSSPHAVLRMRSVSRPHAVLTRGKRAGLDVHHAQRAQRVPIARHLQATAGRAAAGSLRSGFNMPPPDGWLRLKSYMPQSQEDCNLPKSPARLHPAGQAGSGRADAALTSGHPAQKRT